MKEIGQEVYYLVSSDAVSIRKGTIRRIDELKETYKDPLTDELEENNVTKYYIVCGVEVPREYGRESVVTNCYDTEDELISDIIRYV